MLVLLVDWFHPVTSSVAASKSSLTELSKLSTSASCVFNRFNVISDATFSKPGSCACCTWSCFTIWPVWRTCCPCFACVGDCVNWAFDNGIPASSNAFFFKVCRIWLLKIIKKLKISRYRWDEWTEWRKRETYTVRPLIRELIWLRSSLNLKIEARSISISSSVHLPLKI